MTENNTPMPERPMKKQRIYPKCTWEKITQTIKEKCGTFIVEIYGDGPNRVIILPEATQELKTMTTFGRRSPLNLKEQKFVGYGHFIEDENGNFVTIVKHFIEIQTMNRSAVGASNLGPNGENNPGLDFLQYHREEFLAHEAEFNTDLNGHVIDPFMSLCGPSEYVLEGHTHPDLGVFFSDTDKRSGAARAASSPIVIFVCDPVRKQMLGRIGKDFNKARVIVYERTSKNCSDEDYYRDLRQPVEGIVRLTNDCIHSLGFEGRVKLRTKLNGKAYLKIWLKYPKP